MATKRKHTLALPMAVAAEAYFGDSIEDLNGKLADDRALPRLLCWTANPEGMGKRYLPGDRYLIAGNVKLYAILGSVPLAESAPPKNRNENPGTGR